MSTGLRYRETITDLPHTADASELPSIRRATEKAAQTIRGGGIDGCP